MHIKQLLPSRSLSWAFSMHRRHHAGTTLTRFLRAVRHVLGSSENWVCSCVLSVLGVELPRCAERMSDAPGTQPTHCKTAPVRTGTGPPAGHCGWQYQLFCSCRMRAGVHDAGARRSCCPLLTWTWGFMCGIRSSCLCRQGSPALLSLCCFAATMPISYALLAGWAVLVCALETTAAEQEGARVLWGGYC